MTTITCEITLATDTARKIKVKLTKDGDDLTWKTIESSKQGLNLKASNGK